MVTTLETRPLMVLGNADDGISAMKLHPQGLLLFIICSALLYGLGLASVAGFMGVLCTA